MNAAKRNIVLAVMLLCFSYPGGMYAQNLGAPFSVDVINVRGGDDGTSRLDVYTAVPHSSLRFLKEGSTFKARYEIEAEIFSLSEGSRNKSLVDKAVWVGSAQVVDFAETQADTYLSHLSESFFLSPGQYSLIIYVRDLATSDVYQKELITEVRDFSSDVSLSDIILVNDYQLESNSITPRVNDHVFIDDASFKMFYELYSEGSENVFTNVQLIRTSNSRGLPLLRWLFRRWQGDGDRGEITYASTEMLELDKGRFPALIHVPITGFEAGEYLVRVAVEDNEGQSLGISERAITLEWSGYNEYQGRDIDEAIAQLNYIAKPRELKEIQGAKSKQERQERFYAFWDKRDPTPGTPENEQMQEYYLRIDYANRHYSGARSGWQTDQGETLVLYGEPDQVERSAPEVNINQPYEVWYYHRFGMRVIFVDRGGIGNFERVTPAWTERTLIR